MPSVLGSKIEQKKEYPGFSMKSGTPPYPPFWLVFCSPSSSFESETITSKNCQAFYGKREGGRLGGSNEEDSGDRFGGEHRKASCKAGHSVSILDLTSHPDWRSELSALEGDLFGITCVTPNVPIVKEMIGLLPRGIPVILGGPHPTFLPQETLAETGCQAVVRGEGEIAVLKVLEDLRQGTLQRVYEGGAVPASRIPLPARHLVDLRKYRPGGEVTTPIYTSRGCPFHEEARNHDIRIKAYFIVNFPGEREKTVEETLRFVEKARPDKWLLSAFAPLPGSDTFTHPGRYGITWMSPKWEDYYLVGRNGHFKPCFMTAELTFEKQIKLHEKMLKGLSEILGPKQTPSLPFATTVAQT